MSTRPPRILVVDDEEILRCTIRDVLALEGHDVDTARSAEEALEKLDLPGRYDVVLSDNDMPGMQGLDVLAHIRMNDPKLPFIIMTAYGSIDVSLRAHELGASGHLLKPFDDIQVIPKEVEKVLARARKELYLEKREKRFPGGDRECSRG